jgi:hypothetical protein
VCVVRARAELALCPNDNTVEIWAFDGTNWEKEDVLTEVRGARRVARRAASKNKKNRLFSRSTTNW